MRESVDPPFFYLSRLRFQCSFEGCGIPIRVSIQRWDETQKEADCDNGDSHTVTGCFGIPEQHPGAWHVEQWVRDIGCGFE